MSEIEVGDVVEVTEEQKIYLGHDAFLIISEKAEGIVKDIVHCPAFKCKFWSSPEHTEIHVEFDLDRTQRYFKPVDWMLMAKDTHTARDLDVLFGVPLL